MGIETPAEQRGMSPLTPAQRVLILAGLLDTTEQGCDDCDPCLAGQPCCVGTITLGREITDDERAAIAAALVDLRAPASNDVALSLAKHAVNGWACHAKTKREHDEIYRLHSEIDKLRALTALRAPEGCTPVLKRMESWGAIQPTSYPSSSGGISAETLSPPTPPPADLVALVMEWQAVMRELDLESLTWSAPSLEAAERALLAWTPAAPGAPR